MISFVNSNIEEEQYRSNLQSLPRYSIPHKIRLLGKRKLQPMIHCHFFSNPN